jgi:hypothetical protein
MMRSGAACAPVFSRVTTFQKIILSLIGRFIFPIEAAIFAAGASQHRAKAIRYCSVAGKR